MGIKNVIPDISRGYVLDFCLHKTCVIIHHVKENLKCINYNMISNFN